MAVPDGSRTVQRLVDDHYVALYRYAYRLCGISADASDLVQETYLKAQRELSRLRDWSRAKPWLFCILRNTYLHRLRVSKNHPVLSLDVLPAQPAPETLEPPEFDAVQLQNILCELPEEFRTPLILFYFEDFSYRDIAEHMELPIGTVMSRLARAKNHLRKRLTERRV